MSGATWAVALTCLVGGGGTLLPIAAPAAPAVVPVRAVGPRIIHEELSPFGRVLVIDYGRRRHLRFDALEGDDQSMIDLDDPRAVPMDYIRCAAVGLLVPERVERVAMIGLGGGTFSGLVWRSWPAVQIDVAEINPVVIEVAKRFFGVRPDDRLHLHLGDGRRFLEQAMQRFDLIMIDAYVGEGIPAHLRGGDFFAMVGKRLAPGGVMVANISVETPVERELLVQIGGAFPHHACLRTPDTLNLLVFASDTALPGAAVLEQRAAALDARKQVPFALAPLASRVGGCPATGIDQPPAW